MFIYFLKPYKTTVVFFLSGFFVCVCDCLRVSSILQLEIKGHFWRININCYDKVLLFDMHCSYEKNHTIMQSAWKPSLLHSLKSRASPWLKLNFHWVFFTFFSYTKLFYSQISGRALGWDSTSALRPLVMSSAMDPWGFTPPCVPIIKLAVIKLQPSIQCLLLFLQSLVVL